MKKIFNKKVIICIIILVLLIGVTLITFFNPFLYIKVKGNKNITINVNEKLKLPRIRAYIFNKDITNNINKSGKVDTTKVGKYKIEYTIKYLFTNKTAILNINVVDKELPEIKLVGNEEIIICPNIEYQEEGYSALDNYDGDITDKVIINKTNDYIEYNVEDSSKNKTSIKRTLIRKDEEVPNITLNGYLNNKVVVNSEFYEAGYQSFDNCDGDISSSVEVINNVNINKAGRYEIIYKIKDSSGNENSVTRIVEVIEQKKDGFYNNIVEGPTYINGILIVNKNYSIPANFGGTDKTATNALYELQNAASLAGFSMPLLSGYRSYYTQQYLYNSYVDTYGRDLADTFSARPGYSEHQTGLAFDVGSIDDYYGDTAPGIWLKENAHYYGFIIRYPKGKEYITGYKYEPWHIRYLGVDIATDIYNKGITLEEYLGL